MPTRTSIQKKSIVPTLCLVAAFVLESGCATTSVAKPTVSELATEDRNIEVWSWLPGNKSRGTILFSHGAASSPWKYEDLLSNWVAAGYAVHAPLHVDSTEHPLTDEFKGMASWKARLEDIDELARHIGGDAYIIAGHSYGALVALVKGGAQATVPDDFEGPLIDNRARLVIAFSPPGAIPGFVEKDGYSNLAVPALIQTGTQDIPPGGKVGWEAHLDAYHTAPPGGDRYALILDGVDHYFGGAIGRTELPGPKQTAELQTAAEISLLMMDSFFHQDEKTLVELEHRHAETGPVILRTR